MYPSPLPPQAVTTSVVTASSARLPQLMFRGFISVPSRARQRRGEVRERRVEIRGRDWRTVRERYRADGRVLRGRLSLIAHLEIDAVAADGQWVAERAHHHTQRDIDSVISGTS